MQRFEFPLDRVLDWRRKQRDLEESRLASCLQLLNAVDKRIERLRDERASIDREPLRRSTIPAADLFNLSLYHVRVRKEELELAEERRRRLQSAAEQRARVQQAQQRVKLLEKMREGRLAEYTAAASREQEQAATESYLMRWPQSRRSN